MEFVPHEETAPRPPFDFHIVLIEPEIPPNTGSAGRSCVATQSTLHIVGKPMFDMDDKQVRRAGLDYWKYLKLKMHDNFDKFLEWRAQEAPDLELFFIETLTNKNFYSASVPQKAAFIFGKETTGIPKEILKSHADNVYLVPMFSDKIRSLNLSNTVSLVLYEAIRQNLPLK